MCNLRLPTPSVTHVPPLVVRQAPNGVDAVTTKYVELGKGASVVGANVGFCEVGAEVAVGACEVGAAVGKNVADASAHTVKPWYATDPSVDHVMEVPAATVTPCGEFDPV